MIFFFVVRLDYNVSKNICFKVKCGAAFIPKFYYRPNVDNARFAHFYMSGCRCADEPGYFWDEFKEFRSP